MRDRSLIQGLVDRCAGLRRPRSDVAERLVPDGAAEGQPDRHLQSVRGVCPRSAGRHAALAAVAALIGAINLVAFLRGTLRIGGDALNGVVVAGHYFVANQGVYTEVSKAVYDASLWHVHNIIWTFSLAMGGTIYFAHRAVETLKQKAV